MLMTLFATNMFAQEVRGVETRRVIYERQESYQVVGCTMQDKLGESTEYYGFEFKNLNTISVSVTIEIYRKGDSDKLIDTKDIVLNSNESYIHKYPVVKRYEWTGWVCNEYDSRDVKWKKLAEAGKSHFESTYYAKYKAFKLQ